MENGDWRCSICSRTGTTYDLLGQIEGLSFPEAVEALHHVPVDGITDASGNRALRSAILDANAFVAQYYHRVLRDDAEAGQARDYVADRGLIQNALDAYQIGYAPATKDGKAAFRKAFADAGFSRDIGIAAGLLVDSVKGVYPFFRARIMIPVRSETGDVVAFGGRTIITTESRKYVNTAATPVHRKGSSLYGLDTARDEILRTKEAIVVEGYLDCVALQMAGYRNTVAILGTAFTEDQAYTLARLGATVIACFDADIAGERAAKKSQTTAANVGLSLRRLFLPEGTDPDHLLRSTDGASAFAQLLRKATTTTG
jgi:DNA primase